MNLFLLAEVGGKIVGNLTFRAGKRARNLHVGEFGISTTKEYWGLGIGSKMIQFLLVWAQRSQKIRKINLKVRADNNRAISLYKRLGFEEEGVLTREFLVNGEFFSAIYMGICIEPIVT